MSNTDPNSLVGATDAVPDGFTLSISDPLAPEIIREWAYRARRMGVSRDKCNEARRHADAIEDWQLEHGRKVPD